MPWIKWWHKHQVSCFLLTVQILELVPNITSNKKMAMVQPDSFLVTTVLCYMSALSALIFYEKSCMVLGRWSASVKSPYGSFASDNVSPALGGVYWSH